VPEADLVAVVSKSPVIVETHPEIAELDRPIGLDFELLPRTAVTRLYFGDGS
jgi:hypothetical protein